MKSSTEESRLTARRDAYVLLAFVVVAFLVRFSILLFTGSLWEPAAGDGLQWYGLAESLATGHNFSLGGYDVINRTPGYPVALASFFVFTGPSVAWGRILNVILGVICLPLVSQLGKEIWGRRVGLIAAGVLAVDPFHIAWPQYLMSENLLAPLLALLGTLALHPKQTIWRAQLIGAVAAATVLTHPSALPIVTASLLWYVLYWRREKFAGKRLVFAAVTFLLLMSSWTVRNWLLVGSFVPLTSGVESSSGGFVFWISNNHLTAQPGEYWGSFVTAEDYEQLPGFDELSSLPADDVTLRDRKSFEYSLKYLSSNPDVVPMLLLGKLVGFLKPPFESGDEGDVKSRLWYVLPPLYALGLVAHWRHSGKGKLVVAVVAGALLICLIFWGGARYRAPVETFFVLALVASVLQLYSWAQQALVRWSMTHQPST